VCIVISGVSGLNKLLHFNFTSRRARQFIHDLQAEGLIEPSGLIVGPRRYLFSGLLKCAECGGSITLVSGRGRNGADRYGCSLHHQRGVTVCSNSLLVRRDELEESLL